MDVLQTTEMEDLIDVGHRLIRRPTLHLRWCAGVLEQAWQTIREDASGRAISSTVEWRPVPTVDR